LELLGFAFLAFAPGLFWLWFFVRGRAYRPKPRRLLAVAFFLGMLSTVPAAAIEFAVLNDVHIGAGAALADAAFHYLNTQAKSVSSAVDWSLRAQRRSPSTSG
jgi:RsiW-degrading membrane proteinase PrsW (M82 family)